MICRLCLEKCEEHKKIHNPEGCQLQIEFIIRKYFYLKVPIDDSISTVICNSCWTHLEDFHRFYCKIEEAQKKLCGDYLLKRKDESCNADIKENSESESTGTIISKHDSEIESVDREKENIKIDEKTGKTGKTNKEKNEKDIVKRKRGRPKKLSVDIENILPNKREKSQRNVKVLSCSIKSKSQSVCRAPTLAKRKEKKLKTNEPSDFAKKCKEVNENIAKYMKMVCVLCLAECSTFTKIRTHYREKHKCPGYIVCCDKKFYRPGFLWEHINKHINPNYFRCELCSKTYSDKNSLKSHHLIMHTPEERKIYKCDQCSKSFPKTYMLENHKLIHIPKEERKYICEPCGKAFPSKHILQNHIRQIHENAYGTMCHICAKVLHNKATLAKHQLEHAGIVEPKVQCEDCGAWLKNKYGLKRHMKRHTEREEDISNPKEYSCDVCGKISTTRAGLRSHVQYNHQLKPKHRCNICNKSFKSPKSLKEHMTTHTGEVLYTCPHCPKTFNSNANMHSHRKKKHREEWEAKRKAKEKQRELFKKNLEKKDESKDSNEESQKNEVDERNDQSALSVNS